MISVLSSGILRVCIRQSFEILESCMNREELRVDQKGITEYLRGEAKTDDCENLFKTYKECLNV